MTNFLENSPFEAVIGLEVHAQIVSHTKLFSSAPSDVFGKDPNSSVSFVDVAFPGMLPVINEECIKKAILMGIAVKGSVRLVSIFERKHYFYPDNPSGYQISQYRSPIIEGGIIPIQDSLGNIKNIHLHRIHIEQDAGQNIHDQDPSFSYVNFNRAGIGLMEIVSHPELNTADEVVNYVKQLRCLMRYLGVCHGDMEKGQLRVDANVSVHLPGENLGTRVEIKNMNSLKFLHQAVQYEIQRQIIAIESNQPITQETRSFDVVNGVTKPMRTKEDAFGYCYFPDPDLSALVLEQKTIELIANDLPELPWEKRDRYVNEFGLSSYDAKLLVEEKETAIFFEQVISTLSSNELYKLAANWVTGELFANLNRNKICISDCPITPKHLAELVLCISKKELSNLLAKEVFIHMWETRGSPKDIMIEKGLTQVLDQGQLRQWAKDVIEREESQVKQYLGGKDKVLAYLIGQVMKESKGKGNPQMIQKILLEEINSLTH